MENAKRQNTKAWIPWSATPLWCATLILSACGGATPNDQQNLDDLSTKARSFNGIQSIEKTPEGSAFMFRWRGIDESRANYGVFKFENSNEVKFTGAPFTTTNNNYYEYKIPAQGEKPYCFSVRIISIEGDENAQWLCTPDTRQAFGGIAEIELQNDGSYLLQWEKLESEVTYHVFRNTEGEPRSFETPVAIVDGNFWQSPIPPRGVVYCYAVAVKADDAATASTLPELCTKFDAPIVFAGVSNVQDNSGGSTLIEWINPVDPEIQSFRVYQGSDFKELLVSVSGEKNSTEIRNLISGRQYNFGVRAVDKYGREDSNILVRPIILR